MWEKETPRCFANSNTSFFSPAAAVDDDVFVVVVDDGRFPLEELRQDRSTGSVPARRLGAGVSAADAVKAPSAAAGRGRPRRDRPASAARLLTGLSLVRRERRG
jgi:hypothetical protein